MNNKLSRELENMMKRGVNLGSIGMNVVDVVELGDSRALTVLDKPTSKKSRSKVGDCSACQSNDCLGCHYYG